jgi:hypothetical protein
MDSILIYIHYNLKASPLLLLQRIEIISVASFEAPYLDQPLERFEIEY